MNIHVTRDGQDFGPFEIEAVNSYLRGGFLLKTDLAWHEGLPGWVPLHQIAGVQIPALAVPPPVQPVVEPRVVHPVVGQPVAQSVRPKAAFKNMLRKPIRTVVAILIIIVIISYGIHYRKAARKEAADRAEMESWNKVPAGYDAAMRQATQWVVEQDIQRHRSERAEEDRWAADQRTRLNNDRANRADEVNRRALGMPARSLFGYDGQ